MQNIEEKYVFVVFLNLRSTSLLSFHTYPHTFRVRSRYSVGTTPISFLNTFEKYFGSLKPRLNAMAVSVSSVSRNNSDAFIMRIWRTKSTGVMPTDVLMRL